MKKILFILTIAFFTVTVSSCDQSKPKPKWEYLIRSIDDATFDKDMDTLGAHGWEMVFARRASDGVTYAPTFKYEVICKREK